MKIKWVMALAAAFLLPGTAAQATSFVTVDLSPIVNEGFDVGGWFYHGSDFKTALAGATTFGNTGSTVPFRVASTPANNNYWFGLYGGSQTSLFGPLGSATVNVGPHDVTHVYALVANTFGTNGATEFTMTLTGLGGTLTRDFVGGTDTIDYNRCCTANTWFDNGQGQSLSLVDTLVPSGFGLQSIRFDQVDSQDGAIVAGVTLATNGSLPEPATWTMMLGGAGLVGGLLRRRNAAVRIA